MMGITKGKLKGSLTKGEVRVGGNGEKTGKAGKKLEQNQQQDAGEGVKKQGKKGDGCIRAGSRLAGKVNSQQKGKKCNKDQRYQVNQQGIPNA